MADVVGSKTSQLTTQKHELIKQFIALDAQSRPEFVYTAPTNAVNNAECTKTQYVYSSPTSSIIIKMRETLSVWLSSYDI